MNSSTAHAFRLDLVPTEKTAKFTTSPPIRRRNQDVRPREYLTLDEVGALAAAAKRIGRHGYRDRVLILTMYRHALRVGEAARLTWDDVIFARTCTMAVRRLKKGTPSIHPLTGDEVRELKQLQRDSQATRFIFTSERGTPLTTRAIRHIVQRAGEAAGLSFPIHPHMLRHSKGYRLAQKGIDTRAIQAFFGHRRIESTVIYTEVDPSRFRDLIED